LVSVEVYSDIVCPWCRLGVHLFHEAARSAEVAAQLRHRPFQLDPNTPREPRPLVEAMAEKFGGREKTEAIFAEMARRGAAVGLEYRQDRAVMANTFDAHRLLWSALAEHGPEVQSRLAEALYDAHHRDGVDIADRAELVRLAESAGLDRGRAHALLASEELTEEVGTAVRQARQRGVSAVPTFVFPDGEVIQGAADSERLAGALARS
jgi:predicted DsbA family dithiol-disulfide isomerase